ncbi:RAMP superfamily CRISPR-associated protein [Microcoleus sp. herbarium2]|uniref:RAMP superfamily CRISPR-associated protein n=1 Tax=Microcoleus sp. herbarium2 TaxID=3055433 RepID=UPI002FD61413
MSPNPWERPKHSGQAKPKVSGTPNPATQKASTGKQKKIITVGGGSGGGGGGRDSNTPDEPSPWLDPENEPQPDGTASFVEYLRWMRSPDRPYKDATKMQILQMAEEKADYRDRLTQLTHRTKLIAGEGNYFSALCPWRIRTGGHRGPESILLPAFDALGMPYIPSSTVRGVARNQAIREIVAKDKVDWKEAEKLVAPWFGSLESKGGDRAGKVVFLDAYPSPIQKAGGLAVDMANNIWSWDGNSLKYSPNPNPFFSLKEATFVIGLRLASGCNDPSVLQRVRDWLIRGLQAGIGSQVNTGYGEMLVAGEGRPNDEFFRVKFSLEGQLIYGRQKFTPWNWNDRRNEWQMRGQAEAEVRPVAFKSMLRYWFRVLALGVLESTLVKQWEATLFGGINPKKLGWVKFRILEGKVTQKEPRPNRDGKNDPCGEQEGTLTLAYSLEVPASSQSAISELFKNLTWLMFHLGGIGQGARRPCYSRKSRQAAPWYRGSDLIPEGDDSLWDLPDNFKEFKKLFRQRMQEFHTALAVLTGDRVNYLNPRESDVVRRDKWTEAVDKNCRIIVCAGDEDFGKPYPLAVLHSDNLKIPGKDNTGKQVIEQDSVKKIYDPDLCGKVSRDVKPSPVWIADLGDYQIVTVFGATQNPRQKYLATLQQETKLFDI